MKPGAPNLNYREKEKAILDELFQQDRYDKRIRPSGVNGTGEAHSRTRAGSVYYGTAANGWRNECFSDEWVEEWVLFG